MAKLPNYYKVSVDGLNVKLEPIYEELDYKAYYDKHLAEIAHLEMKLMDSEERCRILTEEVAKLSAIKATVEVIFGRKFDA